MQAFIGSGWFILLLVGGFGFLFFLPILIAVCRQTEDLWLVVLCSVIGGLTCIGWPAALYCALAFPRRRRAQISPWGR